MTEEPSNATTASATIGMAPAMKIVHEHMHMSEDDEHESLEFGPAGMRMTVKGNLTKRRDEFWAKVDDAAKGMIATHERLKAAGLVSEKKPAKGEQ